MHERKHNSWGSEKRVENGELHEAITTHDSKLVVGGRMTENIDEINKKKHKLMNIKHKPNLTVASE